MNIFVVLANESWPDVFGEMQPVQIVQAVYFKESYLKIDCPVCEADITVDLR